MDKKAFQINSYAIAIVIFVMVIVIGVQFLSNFAKVNNSFIPESEISKFDNTFNKFSELDNATSSLSSGFNSADESSTEGTPSSSLTFLDRALQTAWASISATFSIFGFMTPALKAVGGYIPIDGKILTLIIVIITISILYAIYRLLFQGDA